MLASLPDAARAAADDEVMARSAAQLWCAGVAIDWSGVHAAASRLRVSLPTYPFERSRHWIDAPPPVHSEGGTPEPVQSAPVQLNSVIKTFSAETAATMQSTPTAKAQSEDGSAQTGRGAELQNRIVALLETLSGEPVAGLSRETSFLEMGFDSLFLSQVTQQLQRDFKVKLTFRQLLGELSTIPALAAFLAAKLPPEPVVVVQSPAPTALASIPAAAPLPAASAASTQAGQAGANAATVEQVIRDQLDVMSRLMAQQLDALRGSGAAPAIAAGPAAAPAAASASPSPQPAEAPSTSAPAPGKSGSRCLRRPAMRLPRR
ncbi:phosphopantetheine-binding protein [Methylocapsa polymorpha]|uniref:Phosphopantetheine-binding protein n=1 Tax=Methylocapsa polymorpha TaxID=3080828 RepID=A0ABZ0HNA7_9HYPH|nr:phosphopantetheine-binding protein [Methylocapsa sp. RX1]